jgi:hypothetical protein
MEETLCQPQAESPNENYLNAPCGAPVPWGNKSLSYVEIPLREPQFRCLARLAEYLCNNIDACFLRSRNQEATISALIAEKDSTCL